MYRIGSKPKFDPQGSFICKKNFKFGSTGFRAGDDFPGKEICDRRRLRQMFDFNHLILVQSEESKKPEPKAKVKTVNERVAEKKPKPKKVAKPKKMLKAKKKKVVKDEIPSENKIFT